MCSRLFMLFSTFTSHCASMQRSAIPLLVSTRIFQEFQIPWRPGDDHITCQAARPSHARPRLGQEFYIKYSGTLFGETVVCVKRHGHSTHNDFSLVMKRSALQIQCLLQAHIVYKNSMYQYFASCRSPSYTPPPARKDTAITPSMWGGQK